METIFLIFALLKGSYSLFVASVNCKNLLKKTVKLSNVSSEKLSESIKYCAILTIIELVGTCFTLIPLMLGVQSMRYILVGFAIWFITGAIEDFTKILTYRWEQKRRQQHSL
ncbi:MAG: hypothetical protein SFY66_03430 [Oculatellaceae cyanobacterium bins.114]|nr:hypothetical protein [Oculatellaceae cyanobacterium bins.114]